MAAPRPSGPNAPGTRSSRCPTCRRPLDAKRACWHCCDRLCSVCGQLTGSAFIESCWSCWFQENGGREHRRDSSADGEPISIEEIRCRLRDLADAAERLNDALGREPALDLAKSAVPLEEIAGSFRRVTANLSAALRAGE